LGQGIRWRLLYHYTSEKEAMKGWIAPDRLVVELANGEVSLDDSMAP
jgi:hypothetical protein